MTVENNYPITEDLISEHGITPDEYQKILELTEREPSYTELGIWSAMWNEHCSYKSSKKWLKTLPTEGPRVIMNALRFGSPDHPKTRHLVSGVVAGVGGYGNSFGVPTVGGEVNFHSRYNGNILVNAFAAGIAKTDAIFYSEAKGVGLPIVYLGAKTGRDGVGGATMASAEFGADIEEKRPTVQVGDPFTEKCLLEACLELMKTGAIISIQDMGAAGLTCSAVEMGAKGNLGVELNLDLVPVREENMSAYEMMLSESQERMLMVLEPSKEEMCSRRWVWEQYDTLIQSNSLQIPGGDSGVIRLVDDEGNPTGRGLAFTSDVTPRYVEADPFEGGKQAVAECFRNLSAVGAEPLATTDNLNFGNPEKPEIMGQFVFSIKGIGEAVSQLSMPIVSGFTCVKCLVWKKALPHKLI